MKVTGLKMRFVMPYQIGGDSDTIACIAGGLAEAFYGVPDNIFDKAYTYLDKDMKRVIKKMLRTKFLNRVIETY